MDVVVYLALVVLGAVFLFSLFILIVICRRRYEYNNRLLVSQSLRFSKLRQENMEDIEQLGPHISQSLCRNRWLEEMTTGLLQHCVAVLKLCHSLTERMANIPLTHQQQHQSQKSPYNELNEFICKATARIVPRFEALLHSMADKDVDIRVVEARVGALVSACWALVAPLSLASPTHKEQLTAIVQEMEFHMAALQMALGKASELEEAQQIELTTKASTSASSQQKQSKQQTCSNAVDEHQQKRTPNGNAIRRGEVSLSEIEENAEATSSLLTDEAPADPAIT